MVRLNGGFSRNSSGGGENGGGGLFSRGVTFWGLVGATMAALKLKEHLDEYRTVPSEPGANPLAPPAYRDDDCDTESAIGLDTTIDMPTRTRTKRGRKCCMCCGLNCGLFCKALGIVILLFTVWNAFKLVRWAVTPSPTGLENMPEYSKSLGCLDASHFYQDKQNVIYTVPVGDKVDHDIVAIGGAVGTLVIAPSESVQETSVKIQASIRTNDANLLQNVAVQTPDSSSPPRGAKSTSFFGLSTPSDAESASACLRYDLTVFLPPNLRTLRISASSVAQVKYSDAFATSPRELGALEVVLQSGAAATMFLPSAGLAADDVTVEMRGGYLVGTLDIANSTAVDTRRGDAITKLTVVPTAYDIPAPGDAAGSGATAHLSSSTGTGRSDFTFENPLGRPVRIVHTTSGMGAGDLYLTYSKAGFNGFIELDARSYTAMNVQSDNKGGAFPGERWAGNKDGGDFLKVSTLGWAGLYF